jgi:dienelactone hydrolase
MRHLEITLIVLQLALTVHLAWNDRLPGAPAPGFILVAPALLAITGVVWEGFRWQMLAAYLAALLVLLRLVPWLPHDSWFSLAWALLTAGLTICAAILSWIFPVFAFPPPGGSYCIGTSEATLTDHSRAETAQGAEPGSRRQVVAQAWYPAQCSIDAATTTYHPKQLAAGLMSQIALVRTHSVSAAPIRLDRERYPLIIFSPSWGGDRRQNTFLFEDLASHGYVVVSLDHPYGTGITLFPDGRVVRNTTQGWLDFASFTAYKQSRARVEKELETRVGDVRFVLDQLANASGPFSKLSRAVDTERAGVMGHSFGGTVAAEVCLLDHRFKGALNMDGLMMGESARIGVPRPFFVMSDDTLVPSSPEIAKMDEPQRLYYSVLLADVDHIEHTLNAYGGYMFTLRRGGHMNFSDTPLYSKLRYFTGAGRIDPYRALTVIRAYALAFFDNCLKGLRAPLLDGPSPAFPEVADFQTRRASSSSEGTC